MCERNTHAARSIDLRVQFSFYFCGPDSRYNLTFEEWKISLLIQQTRDFVFRTHRSPTQIRPLAIERLMNSQIGLLMRLCPARDLRKPRTGHENTGGRHPTVLQGLRDCAIHGMRHAKIVGMNNEQPRRRGITKLLLHRRPGFWGCSLWRLLRGDRKS